jgi:hypothetical protein
LAQSKVRGKVAPERLQRRCSNQKGLDRRKEKLAMWRIPPWEEVKDERLGEGGTQTFVDVYYTTFP